MLTVLVEANNANSVNSFFAFATSRFVNAMRGAAAQNQSPNRDSKGCSKALRRHREPGEVLRLHLILRRMRISLAT
jgi:hypothetical protein